MAFEIYKITNDFPENERYNLTSQIRRSAVSIPSNIAEGRSRGSKQDFVRFLRIAYASGAELETLLELAGRIIGSKETDFLKVKILLNEVMKILNVMSNR